ncbi:MAG: VWA domain-containing protein [Planctomycetes bacterium]|nr:VWA domain-containing protein [Planctomycetota bacterium]
MSFLNALPSSWQWALLATIPLLILLLYFLKLKRRPLEVPSTYLWSRTMEDLHVNTIWQRLRRNLLLVLQILLILLLALALLRPGWRSRALAGDRFILLIDNSASMSATDVPAGRLEQAKEQALRAVDLMKSGDVAMVIAFSDAAQVVQNYTQKKAVLRRAIAAIAPTNRSTDLQVALRPAAGLANPGLTRLQDDQAVDESAPATLLIFSDGAFDAAPDFALGNLDPLFLPVGTADAENRGIVSFATDRDPANPDQMQAFVNVGNFGARTARVELELLLNDDVLDVVELTVPEGATRGWSFDLPAIDQAVLRAVLKPPDALDVDNIAYAVVNRLRLADVLLVTPGNESLRRALETAQVAEIADISLAEPDVLGDAAHQAEADAGAHDLVIYDRCSPRRMPQANTLFLGALPPGDRWQAGKPEGPPLIVDVDRVHPLTQLVDMTPVRIAEGTSLAPPAGSTVLMDSVIGPLYAVGPRDGFEDAVLGFALTSDVEGESILNSNWPRRPSFPVFVLNAVRYLTGAQGPLAVASVSPGSPVTLRAATPVDRVTVVSPAGRRTQLRRDPRNTFIHTDTGTVGVYEVREGPDEQRAQRFVVNLFDERESKIPAHASLELGHEMVPGKVHVLPARHELWKWILGAALAVLCLEWYVYNRRVYL